MGNKLLKKDFVYIGAAICFMILCVIRFWDRTIEETNHLLPFMNNLRAGEVATVFLFVAIILFMAFVLKKNDEKVKTSLYYLLTLLIILLVPMYLCDNYFGVGDVYSWAIVLIALICTLSTDMDWITIILMLLSEAVCPTYNLAGIFVIFIVLLYKALIKKKGISMVYFFLGVILFIALFIALYVTGHISGISIHRISLFRFIVSLALLSPIILFVIKFLWDMIKGKKSEEKFFYVVVFFGGLSNFVLMTIMGDYCRAVVLTTTYFLVVCLSMLSIKDNNFICKYVEAKNVIVKHIPVPVAILIYVFAIITYWYFAMDFIDTETIIEFNLDMLSK